MAHFRKNSDPDECLATAETWEKFNRTDASSLYNSACFRAIIAEVQAKAPGDEAALLAQAQADQAMKWLRQAVDAGWTDAVQMKQDSDLISLRGRDDFKTLLTELEQ